MVAVVVVLTLFSLVMFLMVVSELFENPEDTSTP